MYQEEFITSFQFNGFLKKDPKHSHLSNKEITEKETCDLF